MAKCHECRGSGEIDALDGSSIIKMACPSCKLRNSVKAISGKLAPQINAVRFQRQREKDLRNFEAFTGKKYEDFLKSRLTVLK